MKKKIALIANGWSHEYLRDVGRGIASVGERMNADIFAFVNYCMFSEKAQENRGEFAILSLPEFDDFDGIILFTNTFNTQKEMDCILEKVRKTKTPVVSIEVKIDGVPSVGTDNYYGMYELVKHLFVTHKVKDVLVLGGFADHIENIERLKALKDAAAECKVAIPEGNIICGDWSGEFATAAIQEWTQERSALPEAIICMNDIMALGACDWLKKNGYSVPEDVIVTGYDYTREGQDRRPMLTTVNKRHEQLGIMATRKLLNIINGKGDITLDSLKSNFVCGESCGCMINESALHDKMCRLNMFREDKIDAFDADRHFRHMYQAIRKAETAEQLNFSLSNFMQKEGAWMEGENFALCLHPGFFDAEHGSQAMKVDTYPDEMIAVCSMHQGRSRVVRKVSRSKCFFRAASENQKPGIYLMIPVRSDDKVYGFAILSRNFNLFNDKMTYVWTRHMGQYLEQVRANVKIAALTDRLSRLSITDGLTGVYNRIGCEKLVYPFLEQCRAEDRQAAIIMADVDHMKIINDRNGHEAGDLALCTVAKVLQNFLPSGFMVVRFGGDEFFAAGEWEDSLSVESLRDRLRTGLEEYVKQQNINFNLQVSLGVALMDNTEPFDISAVRHKADMMMYEEKQRHHDNRLVDDIED